MQGEAIIAFECLCHRFACEVLVLQRAPVRCDRLAEFGIQNRPDVVASIGGGFSVSSFRFSQRNAYQIRAIEHMSVQP